MIPSETLDSSLKHSRWVWGHSPVRCPTGGEEGVPSAAASAEHWGGSRRLCCVHVFLLVLQAGEELAPCGRSHVRRPLPPSPHILPLRTSFGRRQTAFLAVGFRPLLLGCPCGGHAQDPLLVESHRHVRCLQLLWPSSAHRLLGARGSGVGLFLHRLFCAPPVLDVRWGSCPFFTRN